MVAGAVVEMAMGGGRGGWGNMERKIERKGKRKKKIEKEGEK